MVKRKEKIKLPVSSAGLLRYDDEVGRGGLKIKPEHVVMASAGIIALRVAASYFIK